MVTKKLITIFLASFFTICMIHANPLNYIEKHGWKECETSKEINLKNFHVYQLNNYEAMLLWRVFPGDYTIKICSREDNSYAIYTTDNIEEFKKALQSISKHQIPEVEWTFTKEDPDSSTKYKGMHWFNNGIVQIQAFECPEYFVPGRIK